MAFLYLILLPFGNILSSTLFNAWHCAIQLFNIIVDLLLRKSSDINISNSRQLQLHVVISVLCLADL